MVYQWLVVFAEFWRLIIEYMQGVTILEFQNMSVTLYEALIGAVVFETVIIAFVNTYNAYNNSNVGDGVDRGGK